MKLGPLLSLAGALAGALVNGMIWPATANAVFVPPRAVSEIDDWYIHEVEETLTVNADSSLKSEINITADVGQVPDKHGIFVTVPTRTFLSKNRVMPQPVELKGITDETGQAHPFTVQKSRDTITWKIGDSNQTVTGQHRYLLDYTTRNAVRFLSDGRAELYWDIWGTEWQLEVDNFSASIIFPEGFDAEQAELNLYSGVLEESVTVPTTAVWADERRLVVVADRPLAAGVGITVSVATPQASLFTPDPLGEQWQYFIINSPAQWLWLALPLLAGAALFLVWRRWGDDPSFNMTVAPEFAVPRNLDPLNMSLIERNGSLAPAAVAATVINLAVKGHLKITAVEGKLMGLIRPDHVLARIPKKDADLTESERELLAKLFLNRETVRLSTLKNKFYEELEKVKNAAEERLTQAGLVEKTGQYIAIGLVVMLASLLGAGSAAVANFGSGPLAVALLLLALVMAVFAVIMPRRSQQNLEAWREIKGFRLYMKTAERYRQRFFEEEGLWERLLPYAILFGLTGKWAALLKDLAAERPAFASYAPIWYVGSSPFAVSDFDKALSQVSTAVSSSLSSSPSSSGSGGGGFSGGGGGGGGGGGW